MFGNSNRILRHCTWENESCWISTVCKTHRREKQYIVILDPYDIYVKALIKGGKQIC